MPGGVKRHGPPAPLFIGRPAAPADRREGPAGPAADKKAIRGPVISGHLTAARARGTGGADDPPIKSRREAPPTAQSPDGLVAAGVRGSVRALATELRRLGALVAVPFDHFEPLRRFR